MNRAPSIALVAMLALAPVAVMAQGTSTASNNSVTNVMTGSTVPTNPDGTVATDPNGNSPYNTHQTINNNGIPRQAPALAVPSVYGLNPCGIGASLGVTTPLFGIGGALQSTDSACEARNNAALAISAFHNEYLAREVSCSIKAFREAWARIGKPCLIDQQARAATSPLGTAPPPLPSPGGASVPPGVIPMPVPGAMYRAVPTTPAATAIMVSPIRTAHSRPDWCATTSPRDGVHPECRG